MGAISPDGKYLAYTPLGERFRQWKNYRGGTASRIWVLKLSDLSHEEIPKPAGGCNDTQPMWIGQTVYFLSDRDGEFNLYSYDPTTKNVVRRTDHDGVPGRERLGGRGEGDLRAGGVPAPLRPGLEPVDQAEDRRGGRPGRDASPVREQRQGHPIGRHLAHGQARGAGVPRRDRHRAGQEGRPAQPHARRPAFTSARPSGRPMASRSPTSPTPRANTPCMSAPRTARASRESTPSRGRASTSGPSGRRTARRSPSSTMPAPCPGSTLAPAAVKRVAAEPIYSPIKTMSCELVARFPMACLHADQQGRVPDDLALFPGPGPIVPADRWPGRGRRAGLRRRRQVPVLPGLDRRRAR